MKVLFAFTAKILEEVYPARGVSTLQSVRQERTENFQGPGSAVA
jgi:hypothetical protein